MNALLYSLTPLVTGAVAVVLILGLWNMLRNGSHSTSQRLMRWRVGLQFLAIIVLMGVVYFKNPT